MREISRADEAFGATAVAFGCFEGIHLGHRKVIEQVVEAASECGDAAACVFTIDRPTGGKLVTDSLRRRILEKLGVELWVRPEFETIRDMTAAQFAEKVIRTELQAKSAVCGFNFRFGAGAAGDAAELRRLCAPLGIGVTVVAPVEEDGEPISSTRIRALIAEGDMESARRLLGRPFCIDFEVVHGQQIGRLMGTPTINQIAEPDFVVPRFGVYASCAWVDGQWLPAVTNFGVRPTVGSETPLYETWIPYYSGDLYGRRVDVALLRFLRPEQKFDGLDALRDRIRADGVAAERIARKCPITEDFCTR